MALSTVGTYTFASSTRQTKRLRYPPGKFFTCMVLGMAVSGGQHASEETIGMGGERCDVKHISKHIFGPKYQQSSDGQRR